MSDNQAALKNLLTFGGLVEDAEKVVGSRYGLRYGSATATVGQSGKEVVVNAPLFKAEEA